MGVIGLLYSYICLGIVGYLNYYNADPTNHFVFSCIVTILLSGYLIYHSLNMLRK